jgi:hypothetical protein
VKPIFFVFFFFFAETLYAQKPVSGTYTYTIAFAEWSGKSLGATCTVKIKGDSIWVIHNGNKELSGEKDEIIDSGIIVKHKTGKWIIAQSANDKYAKEIGGCTDGPRIIDFKRKKLWLC